MKWKIKPGKEVNFNPNRHKVNWGRAVSGPQKAVKDFLFPFWKNHIVLEEMTLPKTGGKRFDLVDLSTKTIIEVSPDEVHLQFNQFMHGSRAGYLKKLKSDYEKMEIAELNGFKFIELNNRHLKELTKEMFKREFDLDL
jgi:hypothetical protein